MEETPQPPPPAPVKGPEEQDKANKTQAERESEDQLSDTKAAIVKEEEPTDGQEDIDEMEEKPPTPPTPPTTPVKGPEEQDNAKKIEEEKVLEDKHLEETIHGEEAQPPEQKDEFNLFGDVYMPETNSQNPYSNANLRMPDEMQFNLFGDHSPHPLLGKQIQFWPTQDRAEGFAIDIGVFPSLQDKDTEKANAFKMLDQQTPPDEVDKDAKAPLYTDAAMSAEKAQKLAKVAEEKAVKEAAQAQQLEGAAKAAEEAAEDAFEKAKKAKQIEEKELSELRNTEEDAAEAVRQAKVAQQLETEFWKRLVGFR
eukprot:s242_g13.t1